MQTRPDSSKNRVRKEFGSSFTFAKLASDPARFYEIVGIESETFKGLYLQVSEAEAWKTRVNQLSNLRAELDMFLAAFLLAKYDKNTVAKMMDLNQGEIRFLNLHCMAYVQLHLPGQYKIPIATLSPHVVVSHFFSRAAPVPVESEEDCGMELLSPKITA